MNRSLSLSLPSLPSLPFAIFLVSLTLGPNALCDSPLPKRFGHTFEELRNEANIRLSNDPKFGRELLVVESKLTFNEKGACEETNREVWVSRLKDTGDQGTVQRRYSPWYQNQPTYSARVFDRNGKLYELNNEDIIVSSIQSEDRTVLSDDMLLQAVLPGLQEGGIVEELTTTSERAPFFKSGTLKSVLLDALVPTHYLYVEVEAPQDLPLNIGILGPELPIQQSIENGKRYWKIEIQNPKLVDVSKLEGTIPANQHQLSSLVITTGQSWNKIASEYSQIIDQKLQGTDFESILEEISVDRSASQMDQLEKCMHWIQNNIRYTSVALGAASIIPAKPMQMLTKRFGDCKDQSSLLVGLLRELKIQSSVAIANSSTYRTPYASYPALNSFDHAIVMAICDGQEVWVDCTYPGSSARDIPVYLQGKMVLIASADTESLSRIPVLPKESNRYLEERVLRVADDRATYSFDVTTRSSGFFAAQARNETLSSDRSYREQNRLEQYRSFGGNPDFKIESEDDPWHDSGPEFTSVTKANGLPFTFVTQTQRRVILSMKRLFDYLPEAYLMNGDDSDEKVERKYPAPILVPFSYRRSTLIPFANGTSFVINEDRIEEKIGPVSIRKLVEKKSNGDLWVDFELSSDAGELTVANLERLSKIIKEIESTTNRWMAVVTIDVSEEPESVNLTAKQIIEFREDWKRDDSDEKLSTYIHGLLNCGLVQAAISTLEEEMRKTPDRSAVYSLLGECFIVDSLGREFEFGCNLAKAEDMFRKAIALKPQDRIANYFLANCLLRDSDGTMGTTEERERESLELINEYEKHSELSDGMFHIATWLNIKLHNFEAARELFREHYREIDEQCTQVTEWAINENWNEISVMRDRLADDPENLKSVFEAARQNLFELRKYKAGGKLFELETPNDAAQRRVATSVSNLRVNPLPTGNPTSPKEVAIEAVYHVLRSGIDTKDWHGFTLNPDDQDQALEKLDSLLAANRVKIRLNGLYKGRLLDSLALQINVDGSEELGFRCETKIQGVPIAFFVVKEQNQYKLLLRGKKFRSLVNQAREHAKNGNNAGAIKWLEWIMKEFPEGNVLNPEAFSPSKAIWNSSRTKSPELVDRVLKMLDANAAPENFTREFKEWMAAEKSNTKKTHYHRALLENLFDLDRDLFAKEAEEFIQEREGYPLYKFSLVKAYMDRQQLELARERLNQWKDEFPSWLVADFEAKLLFHQGMKTEAIQAFKEAALLYGNEEIWNTLLWTAMFTDYPIQELCALCKDRFDPKNTSVAMLHTLACAKAQTGAISEAIEDLRMVVNQQGNVIKSADWLVIGIIAEQCGLTDSARKAYERVQVDKEVRSAYELAQLRLKMLP
jgi:tetratricopeptide (TPR) repeat protein